MDGSINNVPTKTIPYFNFKIPTSLKGIDPNVLDPRGTYSNPQEWDDRARDLALRFKNNFVKYEDNKIGISLISAGPQI